MRGTVARGLLGPRIAHVARGLVGGRGCTHGYVLTRTRTQPRFTWPYRFKGASRGSGDTKEGTGARGGLRRPLAAFPGPLGGLLERPNFL